MAWPSYVDHRMGIDGVPRRLREIDWDFLVDQEGVSERWCTQGSSLGSTL